MESTTKSLICAKEANIKKRFDMLSELYGVFLEGLGETLRDTIYLNKELLHCAVAAYFDDIEKYKAYAGSRYANKHKQAAFTIKWVSRFKPIQIKESATMNHQLITINASFALFCGFSFLTPEIADCLTQDFYDKLIYNLTYRNILGKEWSMIIELMEKVAGSDKKI